MITSALAARIRIQNDPDKLENGRKSKRQNSMETSAHTNERKTNIPVRERGWGKRRVTAANTRSRVNNVTLSPSPGLLAPGRPAEQSSCSQGWAEVGMLLPEGQGWGRGGHRALG